MAPKKSKVKQKTAEKDVKKERTPPGPAPEPALIPPAESGPEEQPIPVPEPLPLPVPPPIAKQLPDDAKGSISHEDADHPNVQTEDDGWGSGGGGGWSNGGVGGSGGWGNDKGWGDDAADHESESRDDGGDHGNSGWGQTDTTPAHSIEQEQPPLGQPVQDHVPTQATSTPAPPPPVPPPPSPPPSGPPPRPPAVVQPAQPHDQSESSGNTKVAPPQGQGQNPPHLEPKTYTFASAMANRNRPASQPASSAPPSSRPSYYWAPNQPPPPKQPMSTTKGQHNPPLTNLTPWGQPKNVDPWGDFKPQPVPPPAPVPAAAQERPAWYDWGRQPQTAAHPPPPVNHRTAHDYDYDSDDDEYTDDGYTDDDDENYDAWGRPTRANHEWAPDPRKHGKVNHPPPGSDNRMSAGSKPVLSQAEHAQILNAMLNDVHQGFTGYQRQPQRYHPHAPHHNPEPSHHQLEKARRLKQIAEEQRRLAMEMEMRQQQKAHKQHHDQGGGKSSKKQKHKGDGWNDGGWNTTKDEWGTSSGWDNNDGRGQDDNDWGQSGNSGWENGNDRDQGGWGKGGGDGSRDNGGDDWRNSGGRNGWDSGGDAQGKSAGDAWGNSGGDGRNNGGGDGWNSGGGDGWNSGGGDGWNSGGGDGWNSGGGDGWNSGGGDGWNSGGGDGWNSGGGDGWNSGGSKKDKSQGDAWNGHDNSWRNTKGSNGWGANDGWDKNDGWGNGNDEQTWNEAGEEDWGEASRYHVVTDPAQHKSSKTFMYATNAEGPQTTKPSTSSKLGLPSGTVNESDNQAFQPAMKAIFGKERMARDRIYWTYSPENEPQVTSILYWIQQMESFLAFLGLLKFLETKERGALFVNVTFRLKQHPDKPAFDWLGYDQVQASTDRILQHSILATDPAQQTIVFVYLLSRTGNSVAMWRRKLQVPKDMRQKHLQAIKKVKAGLRPDKDYRIHVDELPPSDTGKQTKPTKLSRSKSVMKLKQATKGEPAKPTKDQNPTKLAKSALKKHQRGQSLSTTPEKKRKWWQILRFAD